MFYFIAGVSGLAPGYCTPDLLDFDRLRIVRNIFCIFFT